MKPNSNRISPKTEDFYRYEFKYFLSLSLRQTVENEVSHFMSYDGHVHEELENAYFVRSLYFDNDGSDHFYEKIDGVRERSKFRIRTYEKKFEPEIPVFLEEKNRDGDHVDKHRIEINPDHLEFFCDPDRIWELNWLYSDIPLVDRFIFTSVRRLLKPRVLVDYIRRPYVSSYDMNFRVTFDSQLMAASAQNLHPDSSTNWLHSMAGYTVMEVKFHRRIPAWFHRIIQSNDLKRLSFSKFVKGMETSGLAIDLS